MAQLVLALDSDGDGATTVGEAEAYGRALFARYDADGDGVVDPGARVELAGLMRQRSAVLRASASAGRCGMPPASASAVIVLFRTYALQTISNIAVDGPDEPAYVGKVTIEPGDKRIYLVLSSGQNALWKVDGAVERLERVVLLEGSIAPRLDSAALVGVDPSVVSWAAQEDCVQELGTIDNKNGEQAALIFTNIHGRPFDAYRRVDTVASMSVPSLATVGEDLSHRLLKNQDCQLAMRAGSGGFFDRAADSPATCDWIKAEMEAMFPGGVADIDAGQVVSRTPVKPYEVLPSPAGYAAALQSGTLSDLSKGLQIRYRIERPLSHFPPSNYLRRHIILELAPGVPMPEGDRRQLCILNENSTVISPGEGNRCDKGY